jgi:hypothetical protein
MRMLGTSAECGPIWELGWLTRLLHLGSPIAEGTDTIRVAQIVGTVERGRDFDRCWRPLRRQLARRLYELEAADPPGLDEPIDVVRVDRAYFVMDGHKRVALANRTGREFLDANVSRVPTEYELDPNIEESAIVRTAREAEFRRHSGLNVSVPEARFVLTDVDAYGELFRSVQAHAQVIAERERRFVPMPTASAEWYASVYLPAVAEARRSIGDLLDVCSDGDVFLALNRLQLAWWGSECDAPGCATDRLRDERRLEDGRRRSVLGGLLRRPTQPATSEPRVLPLADSQPEQ